MSLAAMQQRCGYSLSLCHYDCAVSLCGSEGSAQTQKYDPSFEPLRALVDLLNRNTLDCSTVRMSQTQPQIKTIVTGRDCKPSRKADQPSHWNQHESRSGHTIQTFDLGGHASRRPVLGACQIVFLVCDYKRHGFSFCGGPET